MEFNARYLMMSLFALTIILSGFIFVYWLQNGIGFGSRTAYQVRFSVPVSGLASGSNVLFNGVKVGEVTSISIDPSDASALVAGISVDSGVPVRNNTVAGVDFQGLTGAANILLIGQSQAGEQLEPVDGNPPIIVADPARSRSWTDNAGRVLSSLDKVLSGENNRLNKILEGIERMVRGDVAVDKTLYDLTAATWPERTDSKPSWLLVIGEPHVLLSLNTPNILELKNPIQWVQLGNAVWTDNLPNLVQVKLIESFENAGYGNAVLRPADAFDAPYKLSLDLRKMHYRSHQEPAVIIDFMVRILTDAGEVIATRHFKDERLIASRDEAEIAREMGVLFSQITKSIVEWCISNLSTG